MRQGGPHALTTIKPAPDPVRIVDPSDGRVDDYRFLPDARARRRIEAPDEASGDPGFFVAEGDHVLERLLASGRRVRSVLLDPPRFERLAGVLRGIDAPVYVADPEVLDAVAGFNVHRGVLAAADRWLLPDGLDLAGRPGMRRIAVLEAINDHENLGVVFRNAAGLGLDAVLLCPRCCDPLYRRSVRVSMGHVLSVPWARLSAWPEALDALRCKGFRIVALTPESGAEPLDADLAAGSPTAILLGAEGTGLSPGVLSRADVRARIPMAPGVDSLNVGSASAVAFFELTKTSITTK